MIRALLFASLALFALPADALAAKRPCLTLDEVQDAHPGRHAKYRAVRKNGVTYRCWFVGRTPAKSQFDVSGRKATKKSRGGSAAQTDPTQLAAGQGTMPTEAREVHLRLATGPRDTHSDSVDPYLCPRGCKNLRGMVIKLGNPDWPRMSPEARLVFVRDAIAARRQWP